MNANDEDNAGEGTAQAMALEEVQNEVRSREARVDDFARRVDALVFELAQQRQSLPRTCTASFVVMHQARKALLKKELRAARAAMKEAEARLRAAREREDALIEELAESESGSGTVEF